jgi:hypothetical protein
MGPDESRNPGGRPTTHLLATACLETMDNFLLSDIMFDAMATAGYGVDVLPEQVNQVNSATQPTYGRDRSTTGLFTVPEGQNEAPGFHFSSNPFSLVYRNLMVPIVGMIDITLSLAANFKPRITSLVYQALPFASVHTISSLYSMTFGVTKQLRVKKPALSYCYKCDTRYLPGDPLESQCAGCRCQLYAAYGCSARQVEIPVVATNILAGWSPFPKTGPKGWPEYVDSLDVLFDKPASCGCVDGVEKGVVHVPSSTIDGLGLLPPYKRWRAVLRQFGARCVLHHPDDYHSIHPDILAAAQKDLSETPRMALGLRVVATTIARWRAFISELDGDRYFLTATSQARPLGDEIQALGNVIVLVATTGAFLEVSRLPSNVKAFMVPLLGDPRTLASWRYILAAASPGPMVFHVVNATVASARNSRDIKILSDKEHSLMSMATGHIWPVFMGNCVIFGPALKGKPKVVWASFAAFGWVYGWDEFAPATFEQPAIVTCGTLVEPQMQAPLVPAGLVGPGPVDFILLARSGRPTIRTTSKFTRGAISAVSRIFAQGRKTFLGGFWHVLLDPRPMPYRVNDELFREFQWDSPELASHMEVNFSGVPATTALEEQAHLSGGIVFFTYGSHGDRVPILAVARHLAMVGAPVTLIHLLSLAEGVETVKNLEAGMDQNFSHFTRAMNVITSSPYAIKIGPWQFSSVLDLTFGLHPPNDVIMPLRMGGNPIVSFLMGMLEKTTDISFRVGAYSRPGWLPRSANGRDFLKHQKNLGTVRAGQVRGSGGKLPTNDKDVEEITDRDHTSVLKNYKVLYCHGNAGLVQTAAASGCQVIVTGDPTFDRRYRDVYDAGAGVNPGACPDAVLLALSGKAPYMGAAWLRRHMFKPWKLLHWYGVTGVATIAYRYLTFAWLVGRASQRITMYTYPMMTALTALGIEAATPLMVVVLWALSKLIDKILETSERDYYWLGASLYDEAMALVSSPISLFVATYANIGWGIVSNWIVRFLKSILVQACGVLQNYIASPSTPTSVDVVYSLCFWHCVPYVHVELLDRARNVAWGLVDTRDGSVGPRPYVPRLVEWPWRTSVDPKVLDEAPIPYGVYGVVWNCYTAIYTSLGARRVLLGPGGAPIYAVSVATGLVIGFAAFASSAIVLLVDVIPSSIGLEPTSHRYEVGVLKKSLWNLAVEIGRTPGDALSALIHWASSLH